MNPTQLRQLGIAEEIKTLTKELVQLQKDSNEQDNVVDMVVVVGVRGLDCTEEKCNCSTDTFIFGTEPQIVNSLASSYDSDEEFQSIMHSLAFRTMIAR